MNSAEGGVMKKQRKIIDFARAKARKSVGLGLLGSDRHAAFKRKAPLAVGARKGRHSLRPKGRKKELSLKERNQIIEEYLPMIQCVARRISSRLPAHIQHNDLISSGVFGLMDAIKKYDPERNNKFKTYAEFRVRGAILDALRSQDWTPRSIRDKAKKIEKTVKRLEQNLSRHPTEIEIAQALNISLEDYHIALGQTKEVNIISIDEGAVFEHDKSLMMKMLEESDSSLMWLNRKDIHQIIIDAIKELPERQRIVLSLYYYEEFNLRKIGEILKVTESRVSQLHTQAIEKLKNKLMNRVEKEDLAVA